VRNVLTRTVFAATVSAVIGAALLSGPAGPASGRADRPAASGRASAGGLMTPPASPYPQIGPGTHFLDDAQLLAGMSQPGWYEANIPFLEVPDPTIQSVYYYRWRVWKEHLQETQPGTGQIVTEFLPGIGYAAPFGGIDAAAGHQITEGRWVRDQSYVDSDLRYWLTGPGLASQTVDPYASDWADEYSNWIVYAAWQQALVTGDMSSLEAMEPALIRQYDSWSGHLDSGTGLYWQLPVWDAMEQSASSYSSSDSYSGVQTLRPTINAYQYGAAEVISRLAAMRHDTATARAFAAKAAALKAGVQRYLWSSGQQFFDDVLLPGNPGLTQLDQRQETGFVPWYFDMPQPSDSVAWKQIMDPQGFYTPYGPTTLEVRSPLYMYDAYTPGAYDGGCCHWDGPSWPFATSQTLTGLANLLDDYPAQPYVTAADYDTLLQDYAATQMKNGSPYVAEAHDPSSPTWIYDQPDHSEDYLHSTFNDLVISGLIGLRPQPGNTLVLKPLVPASWTYFALENVPYHGHNVTVLYDRTGDRYHQGPGFHVYVDGRQVAWTPDVQDMTVRIPAAVSTAPASVFVDDTVNTTGSGYPMPSASDTWQDDSVWNAVDGKVWYDEIPEVDTRWTNYESPNASDSYAVDLGAAIPLDEVRYYSYCDGGGIQDPAAYQVQYWTGSAWADVPDQTRTPAAPACNDLNRVVFPPITTSQVRLVLTNPPGHFVGITELEAGSWASTAARLALGPPADTPLQVTVGQPATVTTAFTNASGRAETAESVSLDMPPGWTAVPGSTPGGHVVPPGGTLRTTWTVTPAPGAQPGGSYALWAYASFDQGGRTEQTQAEARAQVAFSLAPFTDVQVDDHFTASDLPSYTQIQPAVTAGTGEIAPTWTLGAGQAQASAAQPWFGMLQSGVAPSSDQSVAVVDPAKLLGDAKNQDSVFVGLAKDAGDYVMTWYNNVSHTSGFDLVQNGVLEPAGFQAYCCASVTINPGDRFALQLSGNTITSWVEPGGTGPWQELLSTTVAPLLDLTDPAVLEQYHYTFGLRGDSGTMAAAQFEGAADPG
jgi:NPCBM-associated, NEW3 domain of alpha-galactosidase/F5/8 type C domain/Trehalase